MFPDTSCFPLPLVPFERYLLLDDRPDYPMTFFVQLNLTGRLGPEAFDAAIGEALSRHPLLRAHVARVPGRGLCWVATRGSGPAVSWAGCGVPLVYPGSHRIDLAAEVGLRIWIRGGDDATVVTFQFHHVCCDGIGALQFIGDLMACYGIRTATTDPKPTLRDVDPAALLRRGDVPKVDLPPTVGRLRVLWETLREAVRFAVRRITPLGTPKAPIGYPVPFSSDENRESPQRDARSLAPLDGVQSLWIDATKARQLASVAAARGATVNDLLIRDLLVTMDAWQSVARPGRSAPWLRIVMPTNLRPSRRTVMPAANVLSFAFLTRRRTECRDPDALLAGIQFETHAIKRWKLGSYFLATVTCLQRIPGALALWTSGKRCLATALLTNLGSDATRSFTARFPRREGRIVMGDVRLEGLIGVAPLRRATRASLAVLGYAGGFSLTAYCDPQSFPAETTGEFLALYRDRIEKTIADA